MKIPGLNDAHLTYCLNVHPGATVEEMEQAVFTSAPAVFAALGQRAAISPPHGIGLWLSDASARFMEETQARRAFATRLRNSGQYVFTLNGFPFGAFHDTRVKQAVYRPDWSDPLRYEHTLRLARILADLLPDGVDGTISTVPVTYREWADADENLVTTSVDALRQIARALKALRDETGRTVRLALEPEPDCLLDDSHAAATFMNERIFATHPDEDMLRDFLGICLDTVHVGVHRQSALDALHTYEQAGVNVFKVQLGAALRVDGGAGVDIPALLAPFTDNVYLHQTSVVRNDVIQSYPDLPDALASVPHDGQWVVHYHVPLSWKDSEGLSSTRDWIEDTFLSEAYRTGVRHFESEVYTLGVFPGAKGRETEILADELAWILNQISAGA